MYIYIYIYTYYIYIYIYIYIHTYRWPHEEKASRPLRVEGMSSMRSLPGWLETRLAQITLNYLNIVLITLNKLKYNKNKKENG